jgi:GntR family transcriptional regulator of arabinose operon
MDTSSQPKTKQVRDQILNWIREGRYGPGDRLPSERQLAIDLDMNHLTVRGGLLMLSKEGLLEKKPRSGNFIKEIRTSELVTQVAMVLPQWLFQGSQQHPTIGMLLKGISQGLNQRDYSLTHMVYNPTQMWIDAGETAVYRGIKGILLWANDMISRDDLMRIQDSGIKIVTMMQTLTSQQMSLGLFSVLMDTSNTLCQMLEYLVAMGHRRIVVTLYTKGAQRKYEEALLAEACHQWNLGSIENVKVDISDDDAEMESSNLERIFNRDPLPTAIVAYDEVLAGRLFRYCYQRHIRIPEQLSIVALNDNTPNAHPVSLTAPDTPHLVSKVGHTAAQYLARLIKGEKNVETEIKIRCDIQRKGSVAKPRDSVKVSR